MKESTPVHKVLSLYEKASEQVLNFQKIEMGQKTQI